MIFSFFIKFLSFCLSTSTCIWIRIPHTDPEEQGIRIRIRNTVFSPSQSLRHPPQLDHRCCRSTGGTVPDGIGVSDHGDPAGDGWPVLLGVQVPHLQAQVSRSTHQLANRNRTLSTIFEIKLKWMNQHFFNSERDLGPVLRLRSRFFWVGAESRLFKSAPAASFRQAKTKSLVLVSNMTLRSV